MSAHPAPSAVDRAEIAEIVAVVRRNRAILTAVTLEQARIRLARTRAAEPDIWRDERPLISVRIATYDRPQLLVERAIASVLRQSYPHFEIVVVGDHAGPATAEAIARVADPRVRYRDLPARPRYARFPKAFWATAGTHAANAALGLCRGAWIAPLDDDDEFTPDHLEALLAAARARHLEMAYGTMAAEDAHGHWHEIGREPLTFGQICHGAVLYSARLLCLRYDLFAWLDDEPGDWNLWRRMAALGARIGFVPHVVGRHYAEHSAVDDAERRRLYDRQATPEEILADVLETGGEELLALA
jgi:glycosyltransferase involved in cell wall biosynthesis